MGPGPPAGGGRGGRSRPQLALCHHPRGLGGGEERRRVLDDRKSASSRMSAGCDFSVVCEVAPSASPIRRSSSALEGGQLRSEALSHLLSPVPLLEGCDKLTLTLTATKGASEMKQSEPVIHSDPEIMGGTPVFVGTRVPLATLLDYLEAGQPLSEFLEDFPTVTREQAVAALEQAKEALLARARPALTSACPGVSNASSSATM